MSDDEAEEVSVELGVEEWLESRVVD